MDVDDPISPLSPTRITRVPYTTAHQGPSSPAEALRRVSPVGERDDSSQSGPTPLLSRSLQEDELILAAVTDTSTVEHTQLSPVIESLPTVNPPSTAVPIAVPPARPSVPSQRGVSIPSQAGNPSNNVAFRPDASFTTPISTSPDQTTSRPLSRTHHRVPSRLGSPGSHVPPLQAQVTSGRPPSVASNSSFAVAPFATGKSAPAMAITTSSPGGPENAGSGRPSLDFGAGDLNPFMETTRARRQSSSTSLFPHEDFFARPNNPRQHSGDNSPGSSGFQSLGTAPSQQQQQGGATPSPGTSPGLAASRLIRGFSIRKRTSNGSDTQVQSKPSAMDMLRRFDSGS